MAGEVSSFMPLFPRDYLAGVACMGPEDRGNYSTLLVAMWDRGGWLVLDMESLARLCGTSRKAFEASWQRIKGKFRVNPEISTFTHDRLQEEWRKALEKKRRRTDKAKAAADARWGDDDTAQDACSIPPALLIEGASTPQALLGPCPPSPSPSPDKNPSDSSAEREEPAPADDGTPVVLVLPMKRGRKFEITEQRIAGYRELYPSIDVLLSLKRLRQWLTDNAIKQNASFKGLKTRITYWLSGDEDKASTRRPNAPVQTESPYRRLA